MQVRPIMQVRLTKNGYIYTSTGDNCETLIDYILHSEYPEEFCLSLDFSPNFIAQLMDAGFLVMSCKISSENKDDDESDNENEENKNTEPQFVLMPKHHNIRSILLFKNLHISKSAKHLLNRCELKADADFDKIVDRCVEIHGDDWLTPPLLKSIRAIRNNPASPVHPVSFALYQDGVLQAGEFGIISGHVYTSYSGYHDGNSLGRAQMILTARYLRENGFAFWDLGMPLEYKYTLGAHDINTQEFITLFRSAK